MLLSFFRSFIKALFFPNRRGYSIRGFWGEIKHFNKYGEQIGYSVKSFWGGRKRYDMSGRLISYTVRNFWGGYNTYDANGNLIRKSYRNFWGGYTTYNRFGKKIMESYRSFWGGMNHFDIEDSDSGETFVFEKRKRTKATQNNMTTIHESDNGVVSRPSSNYNSSKVKNEYSRVKKAETKEKKMPYEHGVSHSGDVRHTGKWSSETTTENTINRNKEKADINELFQQHIDKSIPFYESLDELSETYNDYGEGIKILAFAYDDLKEFPAYVQNIGDKLSISPLIRNVQSFTIDKDEIYDARKETVEGLEMNVVDNEFASFCASKIVNDFGNLFPEYEYKNDGMARIQYEFKCGLIITENSWLNMKEAFCVETED